MANLPSFSRRSLLGAGAAAASAAALNRTARAADARPDDVRCGVIGVGGRGYGLLQAIHKSPGVRVTAVCDIEKSHLERAGKAVEEDKPRLFDDYRRLIDFKDLDAVFVATPCYLHREHDVAVLESDRHCYGEKPLALSVEDCRIIVNAAHKSKGLFQIGTQLRYAPPWNTAINAIRAGEFGKTLMIRAHRHNVGDYPHRSSWFFYRKLSGDTICEQAVHEFDLFNWIFDALPLRAAGFGAGGFHKDPPDRDILDRYVLALDYGDKGQVSYNHSWISTPKTYCDGRQEVVYCERAAIDIENGMIFPREGEPRKVSTEPKGDYDQAAVDDFFRCVRENRKPLANVETGFNATMVALLGQKSMDTGRVESMKDLLAGG